MPDFPRSPSDTLTAATDALQQGGGRIPYEGLTAAADNTARLTVVSRSASDSNTATASLKRDAGRSVNESWPYSGTIFADSPVAYWRLDDSGGTAVDQKGSHNGTLHGGVTTGATGALTGDNDTAMSFDGVNGYIDSGTGLGTYNAWTCEAWFKPNGVQTGSPALLTDIYNSTPVGYALAFGGSFSVYAGFYDPGTGGWHQTAGANLTDQVWSHVVGTYDGTTVVLYVNGVAQPGALSVSQAGVSSGLGFRIGRRWDLGDYIKGTIDEVAFYGSALTATRILAHYNAGLGTRQTDYMRTRTATYLRSLADAGKTIKDVVLSGKNIGVFAAVINEYLTPATDSLSKRIEKLLAGVVSSTATVGKLRGRTLSGTISPAGSFIASSVYWSMAAVIKAGARALALTTELREFILQVTNRKSQ